MRFQGKRAVVTGGLSGIGEAVAKRIEAEGGRVAVWDMQGGIKTDISSWESVEAAATETVKQLGGIDILVNSAGIAGPTATVLDVKMEDWHRTIAINLNGTFLTNRAVVPHMMAGNYGRIVNIASIAGKEGNPNASAYSASKAAVIGFTKSLAKELAKIPMGRLGKVDEVASLVCWLASEECSFSTGAVFDVSGGRATY